jgi:hypothetical protein
MTYAWVRLCLAALAILPPLALVILLAPSKGVAFRSLPSWLTWTQSLALVALYAGVIGVSVDMLLDQPSPSLWAEALLIGAYVGLGGIRWLLLVWWIRDWAARHRSRAGRAPRSTEIRHP